MSERDFTLRGRAAVDYRVLMVGFEAYPWLLAAMGLSLLLLLMLTFRFFRQKISDPIDALMKGAADIREGDLGRQIDCAAGSREFEYLMDSFNQMSAQLQNQFNCLYQEELARRDAQIKALQAHINPHFLNNTLETINWQARMSGDAKASKMIEALSTVLDAALDRKGLPEVRLAEEMTYVNAYLYIIAQRFGKRLSVDIDLPDELMERKVPRLILQPVIENAVEHGIGPGGQGHIALRGYLQNGFLILEIENDGGLTPEDGEHIRRLLSPDYDMAGEPSGNIGIANVNQRLRILYGPQCGLSIFPGEGTHYWFEFCVMNNGSLANQLGVPASADDAAGHKWVAALNDMKGLYELGYFPENTLTATDAETVQIFSDGEAAFLVNGSWEVSYLTENHADRLSDYAVSYVPAKGECRASEVIGGISMGYFITVKAWKDPDKREAAVRFVEHMTSDEVLSTFVTTEVTALKNGASPAELNGLQQSAAAANANITGMVGAVQDTISKECKAVLFGSIQSVVTGQMTAEEAVAAAIALN